jgi:hypothetical protein
MMDNDDNGGNKQLHNNQTVHVRGRRKREAVSGNSTNDRITQSTQQSTNNGGKQMGRQ